MNLHYLPYLWNVNDFSVRNIASKLNTWGRVAIAELYATTVYISLIYAIWEVAKKVKVSNRKEILW